LAFVRSLNKLRPFWNSEAITVSLFRETGKTDGFLLMFLTEKTIEEVTEIIKAKPEAKQVFEKMNDMTGKVTAACLEQVL